VPLKSGQRRCSRADRLGETDDLFHGFTFHVQCDKQGCDLRIRTFAGKNLGHDLTGLFTRE